MKILRHVLTATALLGALGPHPAWAQTKTINFLFTDDDQAYVARMQALGKEFEAKNPGVKVEFITSSYDAVQKQLPMQLAVGEGPDVAKIADWQLAPYFLDMRPLMKDPNAFAALHGNSLNWLRQDGINDPKSINGYLASTTLNLPFVNKTLFDQAGVPLPGPNATLKDIVAASTKVAKATGAQIPFTMDRSGHRFAGGAFSYGAQFLKAGKFNFPDPAAKSYISDLYSFTQSGAFPKEMWGAAGGSQYKNMGDEFVNGNVVTYLAGNWMINPFQRKIGDNFEWRALNAPCGPSACYAMPGGTAIAAFKHTKNPKEVATFIEFLGSEKAQREISEKFLILTGADIRSPAFQIKDDSARKSMDVFAANKAKLPPEAITLQKTKGATAVWQSIVQRMSQLIVGEMNLDATYAAMAQDVDKANAAVAKK